MIDQKLFEKYATKIYVVCMIGNVVNMLIWGGLAIFFEKWWLALFSILFIQVPMSKMIKYRK